MSHDLLIDHLVDQAAISCAPERSDYWKDEELNKLRKGCAALMTDVEIAALLGRTEVAVHLKRERLDIPTVRNTPGWCSANKVRERMGMIDGRAVIGWVTKGFILGRNLPQAGKCLMLYEKSLRRFISNPNNWPYFNIEKVRDPHLRRLIALQKDRWGDEWLSTRQAADLVGVDVCKVNQYIRMGRLRAMSTYNKDGRVSVHTEPKWTNNFVRRSHVLALKWNYKYGEGCRKLTDRGEDWIRRALAMNWTAAAIGRSMKVPDQTVRNWIKQYL